VDKLFWFGWFFKGEMEVSLFDQLMFIGELIVFVVTVFLVAVLVARIAKLFGVDIR
jgi:hypothetical protein